MPEADLGKLKTLAKANLYVFAKGVLGFDWLIPRIHQPLCRLLELYNGWDSSLSLPWKAYIPVLEQAGITGERLQKVKSTGLKKAQITLPRGWLKTTLVSQAYPLWRAVRNPEIRVLVTQNTYTNAVSKLRTIREIVEKNAMFRALFPEVLPGPDSTWRSDSLCFSRTKAMNESTFEAAGTRTQVTSRHYDVIIEDDTVAPGLNDLGEDQLIPSRDDVQQAIGWHRLVTPLLVSPGMSQNLVVGTRWYEYDLISWVKENEKESFAFYERACREDKDGKPSETGKVTYPERFNVDVLAGLRSSLGPYLFPCLYLNIVIRSQDMIFKPEWFKYYDTEPANLICYTTVDLAGDPADTKGEPDYNVVLTAGKSITTGRVYVLEYWRQKASPGELVSAIFDHVRKYHPVKVGIETTGGQKQTLYWLRERMHADRMWFSVVNLTHVKKSKELRIQGLQPVVENGALLFRKHQVALVNELLAFPLGRNDDIADALASQLELWAVTVSAEERFRLEGGDPLSFDTAVKELQDRAANRNKNKPLVWDVYDKTDAGMVFV